MLKLLGWLQKKVLNLGPYFPRDSDSFILGRASNECILISRELDVLTKTWKARTNTEPHGLDPSPSPDRT